MSEELNSEQATDNPTPDDGGGEGTGSIEDRARRMGWVDKDEFRGPEHKWVSADQYVQRAEEEHPVLRSQLRRFEERDANWEKHTKELQSEVSEMKGVLNEFREYSRKAEERAYKKARKDIEAEMDRAASEADTEAYQEAKKRLNDLEAEEKENRTQQEQKAEQKQTKSDQGSDGQPQVSQAVKDFVADNPWFQKSPMLNGAMIEIHEQTVMDMPGASEAEQLAESKRRLMKNFPEKFPGQKQNGSGDNERRNQAPTVSSPSGERAKPKNKRTFDALPSDYKQQYERFRQRMPEFTKDEYISNLPEDAWS